MIYIFNTTENQAILDHIANQLEIILNDTLPTNKHFLVSKHFSKSVGNQFFLVIERKVHIKNSRNRWWYDCHKLELTQSSSNFPYCGKPSFLVKELNYYFG